MGSHYFAARQGWSFVSSYGELMTAMHFAAFLNGYRKESDGPAPVPFPWSQAAAEEQISDAEREHFRAELKRRSAFRD